MISTLKILYDEAKIKLLVSGNASYEKNLHPGGRKFIFLKHFNLIFKNKVYTYRTTLTAFFLVEKQRVLPFIARREKNVNAPE